VNQVEVTPDGEIRVGLNEDAPEIGFLSETLVKGGHPITRMRTEELNLEEVFLRVTKGIVS
jgi:hypothetical protein